MVNVILNKIGKSIVKCVVLVSIGSTIANGDVTAFGLTINKSTEQDLKNNQCKFKKITTDAKATNMYSTNGGCYKIDGLKQVFVGVKNNKVKHIVGLFDKEYFKSVKATMDKKYKLVDENIPYVGDALAEWKSANDNIVIRLDSPHLSFDMQLIYIDELYFKELNSAHKQKKHEKSNIMNNTL